MGAESWAVLVVPRSVCLSICVREPGVWEASAHCGCAHLASVGLGGAAEVSRLVGPCQEEPGGCQVEGLWPNLRCDPGVGPGGAEPDHALGGAPVQGSFPPSAQFHPAPCPLENVS